MPDKSQFELHREGLINAYRNAGDRYFALRLEPLFREIKTEEDRILHNDRLKEIATLIGDNSSSFLRTLAHSLIYSEKPNPKRTFIGNVIMAIKHVMTKGQENARRN